MLTKVDIDDYNDMMQAEEFDTESEAINWTVNRILSELPAYQNRDIQEDY